MKKFSRILLTLSLPLVSFAFSSCESGGPLFDEEGDCSTKVQFVFKKHRQALHQIAGKETDAFYASVPSVHLFIYDKESGELVFEQQEKTDNLKSASQLKIGSGTEKCYLPIDLAPGTYKLVAWGGLDETDNNNAFRLTDGTRSGYSHCRIKMNEETGYPVNHEKYDGLYHGIVESVEITVNNISSQIIPIELTKNTNDITVWVQHTNATFANGDYEVVYTDANGSMHFENNNLNDDNKLEYHPHTVSLLTSDSEYNGNTVEAGALIAHLSTSRLHESNVEDAKLEVRNREGNTVYSVPFIKYLLQMQNLTEDNQYYLDCEDTYNCTFYLTGAEEEEGAWVPLRIIINNWVKVPDQNTELGI
ncbi:MAG: FimB/Mfa2 family fimbrial subunit [Muribaculaceae bacterium]|nr:FimB/Mfa2 family fimbrial subunit [Muribaculaceae bacterium]